MKYSDLVDGGASDTEKRAYLAEGDMTAITFRVPRNLKEAAQDEARNRGTSFSALVRACMIQELTKDGR